MTTEFMAIVERLVVEAAIRDLLYTHCRALDRCDLALLASVYHDDAIQMQGPFHGPATRFIEGAVTKFRDTAFGSHHITNVLIDLAGDHAKVESWYLGFARVGRDADGIALDRIVTGRNLDVVARREGTWKIASRYVVYDSNQVLRGSADGADPNLALYAPWGQRGESDISHKFHASAPDVARWWQ